jgi:hypothetical protein
MQTWLDMFQTTITCPSCREHFGTTLAAYRRLYPGMLNSRADFMLFTFRAHNSVNLRLNKPIHISVQSCFDQLQANVKTKPARDYRAAYLNHIRRHWRTMQDASGFTALKKLNEMNKVEIEYFQKHENNFETLITDDIVVLPGQMLNSPTAEIASPVRLDTRNAPRIGLSGGRFQIRR